VLVCRKTTPQPAAPNQDIIAATPGGRRFCTVHFIVNRDDRKISGPRLVFIDHHP
jgi:hypothetical protein